MYNVAKQVLKPRDVSKIIEAGGVSAAVESVSGKVHFSKDTDKTFKDRVQNLIINEYLEKNQK